MRKRLLLVALALFSVTSVRAQTTNYEKILVPVYFPNPIPGAYGSQWESSLWIRNEDTQEVRILTICNILCPPNNGFDLAPGESSKNPGLLQSGAPIPRPGGFVLAIPVGARIRVKMHSQDTTRQSQTWGTEIPTVHHDDFLSGTTSLLPVPTDDRFRVMLRLYTRDENATARFRVRFYALDDARRRGHSEPLLAETEVTGSTATRIDPGYAELAAIGQTFPAVAARDLIRVEVQPLDPAAIYYAFITVTNNETQHITTVTP